MEEESFIAAFGDVPTDLAGDYSQLYIFRAEDFGAWYRRVRDAHEREVDGGVDSMTDADLAGHGLVRLPVDADGVTIRVGDVMKWPYGNGEFIVEGIGGNTLFYIDKDSNECEWTAAGDKHHRHAPTVEDVLRECCYKYHSLLVDDMNDAINGVERDYIAPDEIIAEYAAKLRLAGEE